MEKKRIAILGLGGVGGFIGAPLAKSYINDPQVDIVFICRGETKKVINQQGLTFESVDGTYTIKPELASDQPSEIGILDVLIVATKSYGLVQAIKSYQTCINQNTLIVTQQNMVNSAEVIRENIPTIQGQIIEGCIYVASNIKSPGHIKHLGGPGKVLLGGEVECQWLIDLLQQAGLKVTFQENIKPILWKKFLFLSPSAGVTAAYNATFGQLRDSEDLMQLFENLMGEVQTLAEKFGVSLSTEDIQASKQILNMLPYHSKSSFQLDVEKKTQKTEKVFLVDFIIENGRQLGVDVSYYQKINNRINSLTTI